ncbi:MAG: GNAT family N-acetyltransferase [Anaerolineales bacterium]|nr:GNAT family N-acetyltransferase [Anaerolineales bacterium]
MINIDNFPPIMGFTLREFNSSDTHTLQQFELACSSLDGKTNLTSLEDWEFLVNSEDLSTSSLLAINSPDQIAFAGWFEVDERAEEILAFLDGRVHPEYRGKGYGTNLLDWLESTALSRMSKVAQGRPCTYRIMYYDRAPDAPKLFENKGYELQYIEQEMLRDLKVPWPESELQDIRYTPWSAELKSAFYSVYRAAFRTRTDNLLSAESWHQHFANPESQDYQPNVSILAFKSDIPVAYAVIHSVGPARDRGSEIAWISQIGVHTEYQRQGIGTALLLEIMEQLSQAGYRFIKLSVNVNNPSAISLYENLGFQIINSFTMYQRSL